LFSCQGRKSEARTTTLQGGNDFTNVIANQTKAGIGSILFNDSPQGKLGITGHGIAFIQNNEFNARVEKLLRPSKFFDLIAYDLF